MSRGDVIQLEDATGGSDAALGATTPAGHDALSSGAHGVWYVDWATLCEGGGHVYLLTYDARDTLRSWRVEEWFDGC